MIRVIFEPQVVIRNVSFCHIERLFGEGKFMELSKRGPYFMSPMKSDSLIKKCVLDSQ